MDSSTAPSPWPPCCSDTAIPGQPSSHSTRHSPSSYAAASAASRTFSKGEREASISRAVRLMSCWSVLRSKFIAASSARSRQAEHALGDDVLEDLRGAALDRVAAGAQQLVGPARAAGQGLRAEQVGSQLRELLVALRPHPLDQRALRARLAVLLDRRQPAVGRQADDLRLDVELAEPVGDRAVVQQAARGGLSDLLVEQLAQAHLEEEPEPRALVHQRRQGDLPAVALAADHVLVR